MLGVALRDVLDQGAVIGQKVRCNVNGLCMPDLTVFQAVHGRVQCRQEPKLGADAEVRDNDVECLVQELVFRDL